MPVRIIIYFTKIISEIYSKVKKIMESVGKFMYKKTENVMKFEITRQDSDLSLEYFKDCLDQWLEYIKPTVKHQTHQRYRYLVEHYIEPYIGGYRLQDMNGACLTEFFTMLAQEGKSDGCSGLSISTLNSVRYVIQAAMKYALLYHQADITNLRDSILSSRLSYGKKNPGTELKILSDEELFKIQEHLFHTQRDGYATGILLSLLTGLRLGETCGLQWSDFDWHHSVISVSKTVQRIQTENRAGKKTALYVSSPKSQTSMRLIPIPECIRSDLYKISEEQKKGDFLVTKSEKIPDPRTTEYRFHRILSDLGLQRRNFHILRHTFATQCVESGMDVKTLSSILGHSSITITMNLYVHPTEEMKRRELNQMIAYVEKKRVKRSLEI